MRSFLSGRGGSMLRSPDLIGQRCVRQQAYLADTRTVMAYQGLDQRRLHMEQEMTQLLDAFLKRAITLKEFNTTFQQKTQGTRNVFRMRGTSGGMFLNKLVKYLDDETFTAHLRASLRLPEDTRERQQHMEDLTHYFE